VLLDMAANNFKHDIKRSLIIKEMKQYDLEEFKIIKKDNSYEVYVKKNQF
jgi:ribosomal protein S21